MARDAENSRRGSGQEVRRLVRCGSGKLQGSHRGRRGEGVACVLPYYGIVAQTARKAHRMPQRAKEAQEADQQIRNGRKPWKRREPKGRRYSHP